MRYRGTSILIRVLILGLLLLPVRGSAVFLWGDCYRMLNLLVLNDNVELRDFGQKWFSVQKLHLVEQEPGRKNQFYQHYTISSDQLPFRPHGQYQAGLHLEGAHGQHQRVMLPTLITNRIFESVAYLKPEVTNSHSFIHYLADVPVQSDRVDPSDWTIEKSSKQEDLAVGQVIALGTLESAVRMAMYVGQGFYLTWERGGLLASDMKALQRLSGTDQVLLLTPRPRLAGTRLYAASAPQLVFNTKRPISWEEYDRAWRYDYSGRVQRYVNRSDFTIAQLLKERNRANHPASLISRKLGVSFKNATEIPTSTPEPNGEIKESSFIRFTIPRLRDYVANYGKIMLSELAAGRLSTEDILMPARVYRNWQGEERILVYGEEPPTGFHEIDPTRVPDPVIGRMLNQGFAPISIGRGYHDSNHFDAFAQFPVTYMKPLRALIRQMGSPECTLSLAEKRLRVFYALEVLSLIPRQHAAKLREVLAPPLQSKDDKLVTVAEVAQYFADKDYASEVYPHAIALLAKTDRWIENYGGGARDLGLSWQDSDLAARENISGMAARLRLMINHASGKDLQFEDPHERLLVQKHGSMPAAIKHQLARLEVAMKESTRIPVENFLSDLGKNQTDPKSDLYRMFIASGISDEIDGRPNGDETLESTLRARVSPSLEALIPSRR